MDQKLFPIDNISIFADLSGMSYTNGVYYSHVNNNYHFIITPDVDFGQDVPYNNISGKQITISGILKDGFSLSTCSADIIIFENIDTSRMTVTTGMFQNIYCTELILNIDTSNVINMASMFERCTIQNLDMSKLDTSNVINMAFMFNFCNFNNLNISFNMSNVLDTRRMFLHTVIKSFTHKLNLSKVKLMDCMFMNANITVLNLNNVTLNLDASVACMFKYATFQHFKWNTFEQLKNFNIQNLFEFCNIETVKIGYFPLNTDTMKLFYAQINNRKDK